MSPSPEHLILIHGAWSGAWMWDGLTEALTGMGRSVQALDLPGDGHHPIPARDAEQADFHACLAKAIAAAPGPVCLVGHSGGGMLVTAGAQAHPDRVTCGVWIAGMLIPDGRSFDDVQDDIMGPGNRFGVTPHVELSQDGRVSTVPTDIAISHFMQDVPPTIAKAAARRLTPQPVSGHRLRTQTDEHFAQLPKLYIVAKQDRSVLPAAQYQMAASTSNVTLAKCDAGHVPHMTQPDRVAQTLTDWLDALGPTRDPKTG